MDVEKVEDDRLRLIFTCCHPALPPDAQIALTLREVCGLTTEEIARAFLLPAPTSTAGMLCSQSVRDAPCRYAERAYAMSDAFPFRTSPAPQPKPAGGEQRDPKSRRRRCSHEASQRR